MKETKREKQKKREKTILRTKEMGEWNETLNKGRDKGYERINKKIKKRCREKHPDFLILNL